MKITGKVFKKTKKVNPIKIELTLQTFNKELITFQVRPKNFIKMILVDKNQNVVVEYKNEISDNGKVSINNLILTDIKLN